MVGPETGSARQLGGPLAENRADFPRSENHRYPWRGALESTGFLAKENRGGGAAGG